MTFNLLGSQQNVCAVKCPVCSYYLLYICVYPRVHGFAWELPTKHKWQKKKKLKMERGNPMCIYSVHLLLETVLQFSLAVRFNSFVVFAAVGFKAWQTDDSQKNNSNSISTFDHREHYTIPQGVHISTHCIGYLHSIQRRDLKQEEAGSVMGGNQLRRLNFVEYFVSDGRSLIDCLSVYLRLISWPR